MSSDIAQAKSKLPLPALLHELGLGQHASKSALCPLHEDSNNSFSIFRANGNGPWQWNCFAGCGSGDEIDFLSKKDGLSKGDAIRRYCALAGVNGSKPPVGNAFQKAKAIMQSQPTTFDWQSRVDAVTPQHLEKLSEWRAFSPEFCTELHEKKLIGLYNGLWAFPVYDAQNNVVGTHYRQDDGRDWRYHPVGTRATPFVIGKLIPGEPVDVFESTWDGLNYMDKSGERSGVVIARGAKNAKKVAPLISECSYCVIWTQNDKPGADFEKDLVAATTCEIKRAKVPEQYKDLNEWTRAGATVEQLLHALCKAELLARTPTPAPPPEKPLIEFVSPAEIRSYQPPDDALLVGNYHIVKGGMFIIGGAPGVGKSRAIVALAQAGALRKEWFGLAVRRKLRIMIIQTENGMVRLRNEFLDLNFHEMEECVRISKPPPFGLCFKREDFRKQLARGIEVFGPNVVIIDPWISATSKDKAEDYLDTLALVRSVLPEGDDKPALGIVAHTRKPLPNERANGRALLHMIAGSFTIGAVARSVFVLQSASDDTTDNRIVWTCCKNNDGELGQRSAWERRNGLFAPVSDFDWNAFDDPPRANELISESVMEAVFEDGPLTRGEAVKRIRQFTDASQSGAYKAINDRFKSRLLNVAGRLSWT
jgi:AAA domain/CHC2 zinc finger